MSNHPPAVRDAALAAYASGLNAREVGEAHGISRHTVSRWVTEAGIGRGPGPKPGGTNAGEEKRDALVEDYHEHGFDSWTALAARHGVSRYTAKAWVEAAGTREYVADRDIAWHGDWQRVGLIMRPVGVAS